MPITLFIEDVTMLDYAYLTPDVSVAGDSLILGVELAGTVDANGFILDFGKAKPLIKRAVDSALDHRLLVPLRDRALTFRIDEKVALVCYGGMAYEAPGEAIVGIDAAFITREAIVRHIEALLKPLMPGNVTFVKASLQHDTRATAGPSFAYTHGLRTHDGNCQRLLHGHRGIALVEWDGVRDTKLESWLVQKLDGAHFACKRDVKGDQITYLAEQGRFTASLPAGRIIALDAEPSIENLARFTFDIVMREHALDGSRLRVRCYEGARKGASI